MWNSNTINTTNRSTANQLFPAAPNRTPLGIVTALSYTLARLRGLPKGLSMVFLWYMEGNNKNFTYVIRFHSRCLRTILGISRRDHITVDELMKRAWIENLSNIVRVRTLTLAEHIRRLPSDRPASVTMQWEPDGGRRRRGRTRKTWRQTFR